MTDQTPNREHLLEALNRTVADAAAYLCCVDETLSDGHQTARGVLAQMVYWHEQYLSIAKAICEGRKPELRQGTYESINAIARQRYAAEPQTFLASRLAAVQHELDEYLRAIPDWSVNFPVKHDSGFCTLGERVRLIEEHIRNRVTILKRAEAAPKRVKHAAPEL